MQDDINKQLAFEIKKEMADRYFGFRRLIEQDIHDYDDKILASFRRLEQKIGFDLVRLYILLKDEEIIHEFFKLAGLEEMMFYDPYLAESPTLRKKVFAGHRTRGLTRRARFRNMVYDTYEALSNDIEEYRRHLVKLDQERENIVAEIDHFYRKHDLGTMMDFLRSIDGSMSSAGGMEGGMVIRPGDGLDEKMRVKPPPPVDELLPRIPPVAPLGRIKAPMKRLVDRAFQLHDHIDVKDIVHP
ncbi:MAG: hypothetical protein Kow0089_01540 [Desulfobulbaceae bacterium]